MKVAADIKDAHDETKIAIANKEKARTPKEKDALQIAVKSMKKLVPKQKQTWSEREISKNKAMSFGKFYFFLLAMTTSNAFYTTALTNFYLNFLQQLQQICKI